MTLIT